MGTILYGIDTAALCFAVAAATSGPATLVSYNDSFLIDVIPMRAFKILAVAVGGILAGFAIVLIAVWMFVNPNDYKDRIEKSVESATGRPFALPGDLKLSVFPWVALEMGPASLGNPPGFAPGIFASVQHVALRVKLLPLLRKQLQIGRLEVDGLDLNLQRNADGKGNWQDFGGKNAPTESAPTRGGATALPELAGVILNDGRLSYGGVVVDRVDLNIGHLAPAVPVPVKLSLQFTPGRGGQPIALTGDFYMTFDMANKRLRFAPAQISGTLPRKPGVDKASWTLSAPELSVDLGAQTLSMPQYSMQLADAHLAGGLRGSQILDAPRLDGSFKLDSVAPRALLMRLGLTPPETSDAKALGKLSASGEFSFGGNAVRATHLTVLLDDSNLRGDVALIDLDTRALRFDLNLDQIDIDRYLSPRQAPRKAETEPLPAPSDAVKSLRMNGSLAIGRATVAGVDLRDVRIGVASKDGVTQIAPATARLYGGNYSGEITLDASGNQPLIRLDQRMTGIDVAQLLQDFAKTRRISGRGTVTTILTARGSGRDALIGSLSGRVTADLDNGAIEGADLWWEINRTMALIDKRPLPSGDGNGRTAFETFKASADLTNGVAVIKDLNITSQNLHVTGQGTANLVTQAIDFRVSAKLLKSAGGASAANERSVADIPVTINGSMSSPKVRPDLQGMAKARVQQELEKHKTDLKQKLHDKLKDLFH